MINLNSFLRNESLKNYCTFSIGGKAKFLFVARKKSSLLNACRYCKKHNIKYKVIGEGANLVFSDEGFNGAIIVNKTQKIKIKDRSVFVDSGVNLTKLIFVLKEKNLCNFERLATIPATIGGAVVNSVSAFETNLSDYIESVECYHKSNLKNKIILSFKECKFSYRSSIFQNNEYMVTAVKLRLRKSNRFLIQKNIDLATQLKVSTQPVGFRSAGSVFKRGSVIPAKVIDKLGLKGTKMNDAQISTIHAGYIVNTNHATANDVKKLVELIEKKVFESQNIAMEREIEFVDY